MRAGFYEAPQRATARGTLGIGAGRLCVLLVSGGWGIGPLSESAIALARDGMDVLAVAGSNIHLRAALLAAKREHPSITVFGWTDSMPQLMAAADVVVTCAGQTCHEVRAVGRILVLLDAVPGHGRENLLHELTLGGASACSPDPASVLAAVRSASRSSGRPAPWPVASAVAWEKELAAALMLTGLRMPDGLV